MKEAERNAIKIKAEQFSIVSPYLRVSMKTLKDEAWKQAHSFTTVEETLYFYAQHEGAWNAVSVCATFLGLISASDETTEKDGWNPHIKGRKIEVIIRLNSRQSWQEYICL